MISVHKQSENDQTLFNTIEVKGGIELKVEEIVARWQQNREAQKQRLENYMASSFMSLHFENTNLGPGFDVSTQLKVFFKRDGQMEMLVKLELPAELTTKIRSIRHYSGIPLDARFVTDELVAAEKGEKN